MIRANMMSAFDASNIEATRSSALTRDVPTDVTINANVSDLSFITLIGSSDNNTNVYSISGGVPTHVSGNNKIVINSASGTTVNVTQSYVTGDPVILIYG